MLGALVGAGDRADTLADRLAANLESVRRRATQRSARPKVYFEEWDDPMISGIAWVSELIGIAGGNDIFPELAVCKSAKDRIVTADEVISRGPDIIIGSWCGKKFNKAHVVARPGFDSIPAIRRGQVHEIKSPLILQPGPAALTDGLAALEAIIGADTTLAAS
jgi:iron complex transport system substrate-binding protein